jgi:chromosome segregation ATPase
VLPKECPYAEPKPAEPQRECEITYVGGCIPVALGRAVVHNSTTTPVEYVRMVEHSALTEALARVRGLEKLMREKDAHRDHLLVKLEKAKAEIERLNREYADDHSGDCDIPAVKHLRWELHKANALINEQEKALARIFSDAGKLTEERDRMDALAIEWQSKFADIETKLAVAVDALIKMKTIPTAPIEEIERARSIIRSAASEALARIEGKA